MKREKYLAASLCMLALLVGNVHAAVLAGWDVAGVDLDSGVGVVSNIPPYIFYPTASEADRVTGRLVLGPGVNPSTSADQYGFKIAASDQTNALDGAIAAGHYIEFSITVESGYVMNLESIEMAGEGTSGACSNIVLMSSVDGFVPGQEMALAYPANMTGGFDTDSSGFGAPIDLSATQYQALTGTVLFRLYGWNSTSGSSTTRIRNLSGDDLVIHGNIVALSGEGFPELSMQCTNGMASVVAHFHGSAPANYILQQVVDLSDTNGWHTISDPVSGSTNWMLELTNQAGFFRMVPE